MTWKRVATALVLIPVIVGLVLFTPTWIVAIATAAITILALWEYFALGDAIGHRAYRVWTIVCSLLLIMGATSSHPKAYVRLALPGASIPEATPDLRTLSRLMERSGALHSAADVFFLFVLGLMVLTLFTK